MRLVGAPLLLVVAATVSAGDACRPHVEEHARWKTAHFRAHTDAFESCPVSEDEYLRVLSGWLASLPDGYRLESVFLGRAVGFPWISEHIARSSLLSEERPASLDDAGRANAFVESLLDAPDFRRRLEAPFADSPYALGSVSVEKVLVDDAKNVLGDSEAAAGGVPYDAMIWLVLERR